jgi:hypothetical protein
MTYRRQRHRGRRDDRRQTQTKSKVKNAGGDRYAHDIVDEREEQVLLILRIVARVRRRAVTKPRRSPRSRLTPAL